MRKRELQKGKEKSKKLWPLLLKSWSWRIRVSIPVLPACEAGALPFELIPQGICRYGNLWVKKSHFQVLLSLPQSESKCENNCALHGNETACTTHFYMKGFALGLVLKQRHNIKNIWDIWRHIFTCSLESWRWIFWSFDAVERMN